MWSVLEKLTCLTEAEFGASGLRRLVCRAASAGLRPGARVSFRGRGIARTAVGSDGMVLLSFSMSNRIP